MLKVIRLILIGLSLTACASINNSAANQLAAQLQGSGVQVISQSGQSKLLIPNDILFRTGSARLNPSSYRILNHIEDMLAQYPNTPIKITTFTDNKGSSSANQHLSIRRARAIAGYLRYRGLDPKRLHIQGLGAQNPLASNDTAAGRAQNRRVEIELTH